MKENNTKFNYAVSIIIDRRKIKLIVVNSKELNLKYNNYISYYTETLQYVVKTLKNLV